LSFPLGSRVPLRLREHDYSSPGGYFLTICAHERKMLFEGGIIEAIAATWGEIPLRFEGIEPDAFVIMPNHVHGIIVVTDEARRAETSRGQSAQSSAIVESPVGEALEPPLREPPLHRTRPASFRVERSQMLIPRVVNYFKSVSGKNINLLRGAPGDPVWQRGYYEHVIRSEAELARVRQYIQDNPSGWDTDPENPSSTERHTPKGGCGTIQRLVMPPDWSV